MSFKKLQDLLKPNNMSSKETGRNTPSYNKSPLSGSHHLTPLGSNIGSGITNTPPAYHNLPISQNMFYNPTVKSNELVPPSPMIQAPFVIRPGEFNQALHHPLSTQSEGFASQGRNLVNDNDVSGSLNSILLQMQNHYPSQPKNLEELLQRSFSSMPSNSLFQSFHSAMPSPFIGHNTPSSHFHHMSMGSEFSRGFNSNLLGTPLQNPHLFNNKHINPPQSNEAVHNMLISQLAELLKQENENKIKPAIAELLLKYKGLGLLPDKVLGKEMANLEDMVNFNRPPTQQQQLWQMHQAPLTPQAQLQLQQAQHQQQQQQWRLRQQSQAQAQPKEINSLPTFSLTSGLTMHPLQRNDDGKQGANALSDLKNSIPSNKVENTRKGLFVMEPITERKQSLGFPINQLSQQIQQISLPSASLQVKAAHVTSSMGSLKQELDHLTLDNEQDNRTNEQRQFRFESNKELDDLRNLLTERAELNHTAPGLYSPSARVDKIMRYKGRIGKYRSNHPVNRVFKGRSMIAGKKPRIKGKFVTLEEYMEHLKCQVKDDGDHMDEKGRLNWTEPLYDDNLNESTTYNDSDKSLRDRDTLIKEEAS